MPGDPPAGASVQSRPLPISITAAVFGALPRGPRRRLAIAIAVTVALHGGLGIWAWLGAGEVSQARRPPAGAVAVVQVVELAAPEPLPRDEPSAEPKGEPPPSKSPPAPAAKRSSAPAAPGRSQPARPEFAAPAAVITADAAGPVDLTGDTVVASTAAAFAGGLTTATGGPNAGGVAAVRGGGPVTAAFGSPIGSPDLARPVSLEGRTWSCPWPAEAEPEQIERQMVVVRVAVDPDGTVLSAEVVVDPGHGFGPAAMACALGTRFTPARDRTGTAIRARSPPIRVTFVR